MIGVITDTIQSKLATLREMSNNGNIDCVNMDVILAELLLIPPTTKQKELMEEQ